MKNKFLLTLSFFVIFLNAYLFFMNIGVFLDDVFIYFRVSDTFLKFGEPSINRGDNYFSVTSPLWLLLLSFFKLTFKEVSYILLSKFLFTFFITLTSILFFFIFYKEYSYLGAFLSIPIFHNFITYTTNGSEIALAFFIISGILYSMRFEKYTLLGFFLGFGYLTRGELILFTIPVLILLLYQKRKITFDFVKIILPLILIFIIWHLYFYQLTGYYFPKSLTAKIIQGKSGAWTLYQEDLFSNLQSSTKGIFFVILFLFPLYELTSLVFLFLGYTILHVIAYSMLRIPNYHWYYYDIYFFGVIFLPISILSLFNILKKFSIFESSVTIKKYSHVFFVFLFLCSNLFFSKILDLTNFKEDERFHKYQLISTFIDKLKKPSVTILSPEIGVFSYFIENSEIRDINGLASPDVSVYNINKLSYFAGKYQPDFIIDPNRVMAGGKSRLDFYHDKKFVSYRILYTKDSEVIYGKVNRPFPISTVSKEFLLNSKSEFEIEYLITLDKLKEVINSPAPSISKITIPKKGKSLRFKYGFRNELEKISDKVLEKEKFDGASFNIYVGKNNIKRNRIFSHNFNPKMESQKKLQRSLKIDLRLYRKKHDELFFEIHPNKTKNFDFTIWSDFLVQ